MPTTFHRLRRLFMLDLRVLDEVRLDPTATLSGVVVAIGSIAMLCLGGWLWWIASGLDDGRAVFLTSVVLGTGFATVGWIVWLIVAYAVLNRFRPTAIDVGALLRTAGFACTPLVLALLMAARPIAFGIGLAAIAAWVAATQMALQRASGRSASEALVANIAGFGVWAVVMSLLATGTNHTVPGPFLAEAIWEGVTGGKIAFLP